MERAVANKETDTGGGRNGYHVRTAILLLTYPLNKEADIRAEMGRLEDLDEITWDDPTERTVYKWTEMSISRRRENY